MLFEKSSPIGPVFAAPMVPVGETAASVEPWPHETTLSWFPLASDGWPPIVWTDPPLRAPVPSVSPTTPAVDDVLMYWPF